jgi:hypothetical protein
MKQDKEITDEEFQRILNSFPEEDQEEEAKDYAGMAIAVSLCTISVCIVVAILLVIWRLSGST